MSASRRKDLEIQKRKIKPQTLSFKQPAPAPVEDLGENMMQPINYNESQLSKISERSLNRSVEESLAEKHQMYSRSQISKQPLHGFVSHSGFGRPIVAEAIGTIPLAAQNSQVVITKHEYPTTYLKSHNYIPRSQWAKGASNNVSFANAMFDYSFDPTQRSSTKRSKTTRRLSGKKSTKKSANKSSAKKRVTTYSDRKSDKSSAKWSLNVI